MLCKSENAIINFVKGSLKMKKIISLVLSMVLSISSMICVFAADEEIKVYLEGNKVNFDVQPQTINDRTMVPIRAIFEAMGATVDWDEATQTAISTKDNTTVKMTLNSTTEYINGNAFEMDVTPVIINGRTLAPARYVAEAFGYYVNWDAMTQSVLISKNANFDISQVKDGTREHPYKFGDTVSMTIYDYNDSYTEKIPSKTVELTLNSLINFEQIKKDASADKYFYIFDENDWFITGTATLVEYNGTDAYSFSDVKYGSKVVNSQLSAVDAYTWYTDPVDYKYISLYKGGSEEIYIHIDSEDLKEGQTFDYFTITYSCGSSYKDEATIWFSLK